MNNFKRQLAFAALSMLIFTMSLCAQQQVSGTVTVIANVTQGTNPISSVQFFIDNVALGAPVAAPPYQVQWNTAQVSNANHKVSATAFDTANPPLQGNGSITVTVSNAQIPPTVNITIPVANSTVTGKTTVQAYATPSGSNTISNMTLVITGSQRASYSNVSGFTYNWNTAPDKKNSPATIAVSARDNVGNASSSSISVKIK